MSVQKTVFGMKYLILPVVLMTIVVSAHAQKAERDYIRRGNRSYRDSLFVDADVYYRKALDANPKSGIAMFNLGNALMQQGKMEDAMKQFTALARTEKDPDLLAQTYHNMGVILHANKDFANAVEAYKESLRNNPTDDETRYNLALAQKQLNDQQQNPQNQQNQNQDQEEQQQDQEDQQQQQNQDQQDQQQQPPQEQQQQENQMSQQNAEQLLNSVMQDEKDVQDKVMKKQVIQGSKLEKDW